MVRHYQIVQDVVKTIKHMQMDRAYFKSTKCTWDAWDHFFFEIFFYREQRSNHNKTALLLFLNWKLIVKLIHKLTGKCDKLKN